MKILLILIALLQYQAAIAGDMLIIGGVSKHSRGRWCEANPGVGWMRELSDDVAIGAAVARNSLCRTSVYAVARWTPIAVGPLRLGANLVAATGYEQDIVVGPTLVVVADLGWAQPMLSYAPPSRGDPAALVLYFAWRFD